MQVVVIVVVVVHILQLKSEHEPRGNLLHLKAFDSLTFLSFVFRLKPRLLTNPGRENENIKLLYESVLLHGKIRLHYVPKNQHMQHQALFFFKQI